jgi:hypothetical protein
MVKLSYGLGLLPLAVSANKAKMLSKGIVDVMFDFIFVVQFVLLFLVVRTSNHFFKLLVENNNIIIKKCRPLCSSTHNANGCCI